MFVIDEPTKRTLPQLDPSKKWSTFPTIGSPRCRSPRSLRPHLNSGWGEGLERPSSRPITIAPDTTRRAWNFNRTAWSRISQSPSTAFLLIICRPTAFLPRDHQENSCTGHKQEKIERTSHRFLGTLPNPAGR